MAIRADTLGASLSIGQATFFGSWQGATGATDCVNVWFAWGYAAFDQQTPNQDKTGSAGSFQAGVAVDLDRAYKFRAQAHDECDIRDAQGANHQGKTFAAQAAFGLPSAGSITETSALLSVDYTPNTNATAGQGGSTAALALHYREQGSAGPYTVVPVASGLSGGGSAGHSKAVVDLVASRSYEFFFRGTRDTANLTQLDSALGVFTTAGPGAPPPGPPPLVADDEWLLAYRNTQDRDRMSADSVRVGALYRSMDPDACRFEVLTNVAFTWQKRTAPGLPNEIFYLDFDIGGSALVVTRLGMEVHGKEAVDLSADLSAAAGVAIATTYSELSHRWTITRTGGGVFNLRTRTGANKERSAWGWYGFDLEADHTGASSYTAEEATFTDVDQQHFLQCFSQGYKDSTGDYTGTPGQVIKLGPEVAAVLFERHLRVPRERVNLASFLAARTERFGKLPVVVHLVQQEPAAKVFGRLENGGLSDIVVDGEGVIHWVPYTDATVRRSFRDEDFLGFSMRRRTENIISGVRVHYRRLPHDKVLGGTTSVELHDESIPARYRRRVVQDFETYLDHQTANAEEVARALLQLGTADPRVAAFRARSKLVDLKVADVVELTRTKALGPLGRLEEVRFKITRLRRNRATGVSDCEAVEYTELD